MRSLVEVVLFLALLWWTSASISRTVGAAHEAQARLAEIVESSNDAIVREALDGTIESWNAGAERLFGYRQEEVAGRHISLIIPPDRSSEIASLLDCLRRGERIDSFDTVRVRKDGTHLHVSLTLSPVLDDAGNVVGASKIAHDITERKKSEELLRQNEAELRERTRVLELLNKTGTVVGSTLELHPLLQAITDLSTEISGAKYGAFFYNTTDENGDAFLLYTLSGAPREAFEKFGRPRATPLFAPTFNGGAPIRCDDVLADPRYGQMPPHRGMPPGHLPVRSYLAVPCRSCHARQK
jgi:PAS domain S-box-containing protein